MQKYIDGISKTGYLFENDIARILKNNKWQVISNKYYIDDQQETVREIDLIAYKCSTFGDFDVYTSLVISCKKSDSCIWGLLSRNINPNDPNTDFEPFHGWSNDKAICFGINKEKFAKNYFKEGREANLAQLFDSPSFDIFAFQEIDKAKGTPQNDKAIFSSITSLMKAQAYELSVLPERIKSKRRKPAIYQFNLISLVDTELVRIIVGDQVDDELVAMEVNNADYITRYIINGKETFARIRFLNAIDFENQLDIYNKLHNFNCRFFKKEQNEFYVDVLKSKEKRAIYEDDFSNELTSKLNSISYDEIKSSKFHINNIELGWNHRENHIWIDVDGEESMESSDFFNSNDESIKAAKELLLKYYRYDGNMKFSFAIPF
ncbi:hypothetical protein [Comamonas terrigena]|uniref:hypothetical protein n=1 Tax=Comamonas terrigena TaxID=32013 RepID=UPI002354A0EC|nr:hypothetical protein [Comamonas terrigena]